MEERFQAVCEQMEQLRAENELLRQQRGSSADWAATSAPLTPRNGTPAPAVLSDVPTCAEKPERVYVYAPKENKCPRFSGDRKSHGQRVEDWIKEVKKALTGQPLAPTEQVTWVCDLLDGEAKREVAFSLNLEDTHIDAIFEVLLEHFGCDQTYVAIQRQFFHRRQGEKETIREFTHALVVLLEQLQRKDPRVVPLPDMVLRDTFIENIHDTKLHQELTQVLRNHPDHSFREVRDLALRWERRQAALGVARPRVMSCETPSTTQVHTSAHAHTAQDHSQELQECRDALRQQQQQLNLILQRLSTSWSAPPIGPSRPATKRPPQRPSPQFLADGTPICLRCQKPGHMARQCPHATPPLIPPSQAPQTQVQAATAAEN